MTVADAGPGVLPAEIPRLFERFYRGNAARATESPGVGLGLAISRALSERQGSCISVETLPGQGAAFSIRLPLAT